MSEQTLTLPEDLILKLSEIGSFALQTCDPDLEQFYSNQKLKQLCGHFSPSPLPNLITISFIKLKLARELELNHARTMATCPALSDSMKIVNNYVSKLIQLQNNLISFSYRHMDYSLLLDGLSLAENEPESNLIKDTASILGFTLSKSQHNHGQLHLEKPKPDNKISKELDQLNRYRQFCRQVEFQIIPLLESFENSYPLSRKVRRLVLAMADYKFNQIMYPEDMPWPQSYEEEALAIETGINLGPDPNDQLNMIKSSLLANLDLY